MGAASEGDFARKARRIHRAIAFFWVNSLTSDLQELRFWSDRDSGLTSVSFA